MREITKRLSPFYIDIPALRPGTIGAFVLAFVTVGVAAALRLALDPYLVGAQFVTFFPAVIITTAISGFGAGFVSAVLSIAAVDFFVLSPRFSFYIDDPAAVADLLLFGPLASYCVILITRMRLAVEHEQAERALRAGKARLQFALDAALLGWWQYDRRRRVASGDTRFKEIFDVTADEIPAEEIKKLVHPYDAERFWADRQASLDPATPSRLAHEYRVQRRGGELRWVEVHWLARPEHEPEAPDIGIGVVQDITDRKKGEEAQARLAAVVTSSADAIVGKTLDGIVTTWNEAAEHMFGYSAGEMIGQSVRRLIPADRWAEEDLILARVAQSESITNYETTRLAKDGRTFDATVTISPVRDAGGRIIGAAKIIRDNTAKKRAEELLQRQANLLDQSHDAIFTWKVDGGITYWSRGAEHLYGYTAEEAVGRSSHELLQTRSPVAMQEIEARIAREGSWYGELTHTTREGREVVVESRHVGVSYGGEIYTLETNRDITARKRAEELAHLLMREASHRAKNMLSLVLAIARQTRARQPEDFVRRFTELVQALAASQDLLVRNEWKGTDVEDLIRTQLAHFADLVGSRIVGHGPKLRLNANAAQAIGLALHELATNAGKYGALSTDGGRVDICWGTDDDTLTMSWTEHGGPPVSPPEQRGFGSTVMVSMVKTAVGGEVQLDYTPSGLVWRLTCPAVNGLERDGPGRLGSTANMKGGGPPVQAIPGS